MQCLLCETAMDKMEEGFECPACRWYADFADMEAIQALKDELGMSKKQYVELKQALIGKAMQFDHAQVVSIAKRYREKAPKIRIQNSPA